MKELYHFTSSWSTPCAAMNSTIKEFLELNNDIVYKKFDFDIDLDFFKENDIKAIPTFISIKDGKKHDRHTGFINIYMLEGLFG